MATAWQVRKQNGDQLSLGDMASIKALAEDGRVCEDDQISRTGQKWRTLGDITELAVFFHPEKVVISALADESSEPQLTLTAQPMDDEVTAEAIDLDLNAWQYNEPLFPDELSATAAAQAKRTNKSRQSRRLEAARRARSRVSPIAIAAGLVMVLGGAQVFSAWLNPRLADDTIDYLVHLSGPTLDRAVAYQLSPTAAPTPATTLPETVAVVAVDAASNPEPKDAVAKPENPVVKTPQTRQPTAPAAQASTKAVATAASTPKSKLLPRLPTAPASSVAPPAAKAVVPTAQPAAKTAKVASASQSRPTKPAPTRVKITAQKTKARAVRTKKASANMADLFQKASALRLKDRAAEALPLYKQVLAKQPRHVDALLGAGWASFDLGAIDGSVSYFRSALRASSKDGRGHLGLAEVYQELGRNNDAATHLKKYLVVSPNGADAAFVQRTIARLQR